MIEERFKNIMKINGFKYKSKKYYREDWIEIEIHWYIYEIAYWNWYTCDCKGKADLIGQLVLEWIINRLF